MIPDEPARGSYPEIELFGLSGYDQLQVWIDRQGPIAPIGRLTGGTFDEFNFDSATFTNPASPWFSTSAGLFPAGIALIPGDVAMGSSVMAGVPPATGFATAQISLSFVRPASPESGILRATSTRIHLSPALALSDVVVEDADGRLLAHGTSRQVIFPPLSPAPTPLDQYPAIKEEDYDTPDPTDRPPDGDILPQELFDRHDGLELARMHLNGETPRPPIVNLLGWRLEEIDEGRCVSTIPSSEWFASSARTIYGGLLGLYADMSLTSAAGTLIPAGGSLATLDLNLNFLRPVFPDGRPLRAESKVVHRGKQIVVTNVDITNADGKTVLIGKSTTMMLPNRKWAESVHASAEHPAAENSSGVAPA